MTKNDSSKTPRLQLRGIRKVYPAVVANDGVDLAIRAGEIHAVVGENGAGKSTLMKIVYGVTRPDAGEILWEGRPVEISRPADARRLGIGMVFQHFSVFETLTVAQNIALGMEGRYRLDELSERIRTVSERYGLPLDPRRLVHSLSVGERQRVEIVRCLLQEPRLLIMDEPTSVLTPQAVTRLFETLRRLAEEGCSILYISHKLEEIRELCDMATVMRLGKVTGVVDPGKEGTAGLARMMIGRELPVCEHGEPRQHDEQRLVVDKLSTTPDDPFSTALRNISFSVDGGEIVGIAGISGNGQQELLKAISGEAPLPPSRAGAVRIEGRPVGHLDAWTRRDLGLAFVPEERLGRGAVPLMSLNENALLTSHRGGMVRHGLIDRGRVREFAERCVKDFDVRCGGTDAAAKSLSGGNLQKFIVGREISQRPEILIASQPTWGVDVGAATAIRQALIDLRNEGAALLVVSEELDELFEICDRIIVMAQGRVSPPRRTSQTSSEEIGLWMSGAFPDEAEPAAEDTHAD
jgi:simple sugar transport system ATP-binding protein